MAVKDKLKNVRKTARVMIVDDHPALREGLAHRIAAQPDLAVCGEASDVEGALNKIRDTRPDLVIVDIALKDSDGLELIKTIKSRHRHVRTLAHSMYDESVYAERCLGAGAMGYVNKEANPDAVIQAAREILAGRVYLSAAMTSALLGRAVSGRPPQADPLDALTDRQLQIFRLLGSGRSAQQIAGCLRISVHTVETHRENIKRKLKVKSVAELTRRAILWVNERA